MILIKYVQAALFTSIKRISKNKTYCPGFLTFDLIIIVLLKKILSFPEIMPNAKAIRIIQSARDLQKLSISNLNYSTIYIFFSFKYQS